MKNNLAKNRLLFFLLLAIVFGYFINDYSLTSPEKTAIVVAIGIDKEDDLYEVSLQVSVPKSAGTTASAEQRALAGKGTTVESAIMDIEKRTGWRMRLNFCNLILLSERLCRDNAMGGLLYLVRTERVLDSALVAVTKDNPLEVFNYTAPMDEVTAFSFQKLLLYQYMQTATAAVANLKDFSISTYGEGRSAYLPYIESVKSVNEQSGGSGGEDSGGGGQASTDKEYTFAASKTAAFLRGKMLDILGEQESFALDVTLNGLPETDITVFDVPTVIYDDFGNAEHTTLDFTVHVVDAEVKEAFERAGGEFYYTVNVEISAALFNISRDTFDYSRVVSTSDLPKEVILACEAQITQAFTDLFLHQEELKCDLAKVGERFYRKEWKEWEKFLAGLDEPDDFYGAIVKNVKVKVTPQNAVEE